MSGAVVIRPHYNIGSHASDTCVTHKEKRYFDGIMCDMGRPQSADKSLFEQEAPEIGTQKRSTKRGVREPLRVEFALNNGELVKAEVFREKSVRANDPIKMKK